jgi:hypothetical protein
MKEDKTMTKITVAVMLATLALMPASALATPQHKYPGAYAFDGHAQSEEVISGNRVIGHDPDPFIRGEILRHYESGWPD